MSDNDFQQEQSNNSSETSAGESVPSEPFSADKNSEVININGRSFRRTTWNGISVIQDVETGYYQASKICKDNGKKLKHWLENKRTDELLEAYALHLGKQIKNSEAAIPTSEPNVLMYKIVSGGTIQVTNEFQGWFIHPKLVHHIAEWASIDYAIKVEEIMNLINEQNKLLNQTLEDTISKLRSENIELKATIQDLTTPINKLNKSTIYASPVGKDYFQLRFSTVTPSNSVNMIKSVQLTNAKDVKEQTMEKLMKEQLVEKKDHKQVIDIDHLDHTFEIIDSVKLNKDEVITLAQRNAYIDAEIDKLKQRPQTKQRDGKIFELEQIKLTKDLIPWALVPQSTRNKYNEIKKDTGIDAVKLEDGNITHIFQYKKHSGEQLTKNELTNFISKFKTIPKTLVTKDCKIGKKLMKSLTDINIEVSII